jgi:hypothetical protein
MRKMITIAATMLAIFVLASPSLLAANGKGAGEGSCFRNFYQWLRDDDGDGIPNCLDPDYARPEDGTGYGKLGPSVSAARTEDGQIGDRDRIRDHDRLKDGSCNETSAGNVYRLRCTRAGSGK